MIRQKTWMRDAPSMTAASSSSFGIAMRNGRRMMIVTGSANAACGSATPHQVFPRCSCRVMMTNSGMIATVAGNSSPRTKTM